MFSTAFPFSIRKMLGLFYSFLFAITSLISTPKAGYTKEMPVAPDDFKPEIRFVVCTDSHDNNDNIVKMINKCFEIYGDEGIDLFAHTGDFSGIGTDEQMIAFRDAWNGAINGRAQSLITMGNHDIKQGYDTHDRFPEIFGVESSNQHIVVKGFHFISIPSYTMSFYQLVPPSKVVWAAKELKKAEADSEKLPVFTFQHPHNRGTVYGSTVWGCNSLNPVWEGHNRVVNFSGHSHFPIEDPRSIWQGTYTCLGVGAMERFELEKDLIWSQHPDGYEDACEFYVVEADKNGAVKVDAYDLNTNKFFLHYFIENVNDPSTFAYTYKNRLKYDDAPVFAENATATYEINENGEYILTFDKATDKLVVHDYRIVVKNSGGIIVFDKTFLSDYFLQNRPDTMTVNLGELNVKPDRGFKVQITASNAYYELSKTLSVEF